MSSRIWFLGSLLVVSACSGSGSSSSNDDASTNDSQSTIDSGVTTDSTSSDTSTDGATDAPVDAPPPVTCDGADGSPAFSRHKWVFWGDLHLHTQNSLDAWSFGTRSSPADAYLFAKKKKSITIGTGTDDPPGPSITIDRPLDFLAVTDHSEWLGVDVGCRDPKSAYYDRPGCVTMRSTKPADESATFGSMGLVRKNLCGAGSATAAQCAAETKTAWEEAQTAAKDANDPCHFTSLVAYEWTNAVAGATHHRNVVFASDKVVDVPLDSVDYPTPAALWKGLDDQCKPSDGCLVLTIPHNTNLSQGGSVVAPTSSEEAAWMQKYQRLAEIYQHKGASECFFDAKGTSTDPDCNFEYGGGGSTDTPQNYLRTALENGISYALTNPSDGNPLALGFVGATDDHNGTPGHVKEDDFTGHAGRLDDSTSLRLKATASAMWHGPGAITGAWAEQNTRDRIYAAFVRRETFATSGPRIPVRFFATKNACTASFPDDVIDAGGVPMGGVIHSSDVAGGAPHFAISAFPDPQPQVLADDSTAVAGLAKVQIIKAHAKLDSTGKASVVEDAPYEVTIDPKGGCVEWSDPSFDAKELAFYYVRVLQVPTWRWSHFDCKADPTSNPTGCAPGGGLDVSVQERAWTSPIWYEP